MLREAAQNLLARLDSRFSEELAGRPRVVFHRLRERGKLSGLQGKRILEIGPKHGSGFGIVGWPTAC